MANLKLIALGKDDLTVLSAHLQDAVLRVADLAWMPRDKRFAMVVNRFDWDDGSPARNSNKRGCTAVRFEHVLAARVQGIDLAAKNTVLSLLAIQFEETGPPDGRINLIFAGDGAICLDVECVEGEVRDLGAEWQTRSRPNHSIVNDNASFETDT